MCNYELNVTFRRQVVVTIEISTTFAATTETGPAKYERFINKTENSFKRKPSLPFRSSTVKKLVYTLLKTMIILTTEFDEGVKNRVVRLDFRWQRIPCLQNTCGPRRDFT